jgi:O-antigen ligase
LNRFLADNRLWRQAAVIGGTLMIAALIGLRAQSRLAWLPGLAVIGLLGLVVLLRYLPWGLVALVPVSFLVDMQVGTGTNVSFNATFLLVLALAGAWMVKMVIIERQVRLRPTPANLPGLLFIGACLLSWLTSFLPWLPLGASRPSLPAQLGAFLLYALSIGGLLLAANLFERRRLVEIFTWLYIGIGTVYLLAQVIPWGFDFALRWFVDAQHGSAVYWTLLASLSMGQALFNQRLKRWGRYSLAAIALLVVVFGLLRRGEWVSGWLPPALAIGVLLWLKDWRMGLVATAVGGLVLLPSFLEYYNAQINTETQQWSSFTRFATWPIVFELIKANPISGLGPAVYPYLTSLYFYLGYYVSFNTHNNYFDIILQSGLIGLALFGWLAAVLLREGWRQGRSKGDGFRRGYANGALAALAATLVAGLFADWFLPFVYNIGIPGFQASIYVWLFAGGLFSQGLAEEGERDG